MHAHAHGYLRVRVRVEPSSVRARKTSHAVGSRDSAAVSTADSADAFRADPPSRYRPCAQLHTCAVRICTCAHATPRSCRGVCLRALRGDTHAFLRAGVASRRCGPSRAAAGTGGIYRPDAGGKGGRAGVFPLESSVDRARCPQVRCGRAARPARNGLAELTTRP